MTTQFGFVLKRLLLLASIVSLSIAAAAAVASVPKVPLDLVPNACGDGRYDQMLESFDAVTPDDFELFTPGAAVPKPMLTVTDGCDGSALGIGYSLTHKTADNQSWVVVKRSFAEMDFSPYTHIRVALRGSHPNSHNDIEIKLSDGSVLHAMQLQSSTDLQAWRPVYIDLRELRGDGVLDLTRITSFEIGVVRCEREACEITNEPQTDPPVNMLTGTLFVDEFALVNLKVGSEHRIVQTKFETLESNTAVAAKAASAILLERTVSTTGTNGLVKAWFPEPSPNYNSYAQAEALLVFIYEYQRTGNEAYKAAAQALATSLLALQIGPGNINAGAWYTAYGKNLEYPLRPEVDRGDGVLVPGSGKRCDGNETMITLLHGQPGAHFIDACQWVGNVGWVLIALNELEASGIYDDKETLRSAIGAGADWLIKQIGRDPNHPHLISLGTEGNISAYFGLLASRKGTAVTELGYAILANNWDTSLQYLKTGVGPYDYVPAMDTSGSWGAALLRSMCLDRLALLSQGYVASILRTSSHDGTIVGYGDIAGPFTVSTEFSAQAVMEGIDEANFVMTQLYALQVPDGQPYAGAFHGAADHFYGGALPPWNTTMAGVSPTAWVYFSTTNNNPFPTRQCVVYIPISPNPR